MATIVEKEVEPQEEELQLEHHLHPRWALRLHHLVLVTTFGALFLLLSYMPLRATDLWSHVLFGQWILDHAAMPTEDFMQPLAAGMKVVDSWWLSQVIFALVERFAGAEGLSALFAITVTATFLVLARAFYLQSQRPLVALLGTLLVLAVGWSRLATIRPENFAALCFAVLLWLIAGFQRSQQAEGGPGRWAKARLWVGVPVVMMLWANLHGSFVCGLVLLGCLVVGAIIDSAWQTRSWRAVVGDAGVRRWLYVTELAFAATLLNPYGFDLLLYSTLFAGNENLRGIIEWQPLVLLGLGGREFAASLVVLLFVLRHSRERVPAAHVLALLAFGGSAVLGVRMLAWYAPVFGLVIVPHLRDLANRLWPRTESDSDQAPAVDENRMPALQPGQSFRYTLLCALMLWVAFALSNISRPVLGGKPRTAQQLYGSSTPLAVAEYLRKSPPKQAAFNPQHWGDWFLWAGPEGFRPFATTQIHLIPPHVWRDYQHISLAQPGWQRVLNRYAINTIIVDPETQPILVPVLRRDEDWLLRYEDEQALVFERKPTRSKQQQTADAAEPGA